MGKWNTFSGHPTRRDGTERGGHGWGGNGARDVMEKVELAEWFVEFVSHSYVSYNFPRNSIFHIKLNAYTFFM